MEGNKATNLEQMKMATLLLVHMEGTDGVLNDLGDPLLGSHTDNPSCLILIFFPKAYQEISSIGRV